MPGDRLFAPIRADRTANRGAGASSGGGVLTITVTSSISASAITRIAQFARWIDSRT